MSYNNFLISLLSLILISACKNDKIESDKLQLTAVDSILVNINLSEDSLRNITLYNIHIINYKEDTVLFLPFPFIIESNLKNINHVWVLSDHGYFTPNIIYVQSTNNKIIFDSDGEYKYSYEYFPELIILPPYDTVKIVLDNIYPINLNTYKIDYFGAIIYCYKKYSDYVAENSSTLIKNLYYNNIVKKNNIRIKPIEKNELEINLKHNKNENELVISGFIWNIFKNKIYFKQ
jgi:hypothetical protein